MDPTEKPAQVKPVNMAGQVLGDLTVRRQSEKKGATGELYWWCRCSCGHNWEVRGSNLRAGKTRRCVKCATRLARDVAMNKREKRQHALR